MHEVRYSFRPGYNGTSIAGSHCLDKPGGVWIAPDCLRITICQRSYRSAIFMLCRSCIEPSKEPVLEAAQRGADPRAIWGALLPDG